jgi:undecaprenyl-diphosphatase
MLEKLLDVDEKLFLFLNGLNSPQLDPLFYFLTNPWAWIPVYILLLYLIWKQYGNATWLILIGIALTVVLSDQVTSNIMKPYFQRLRPTKDPALAGLVHYVNNYKGTLYGFASSHAANTIGTATFVFLLLRKIYSCIGWIFLWAVFVAYTRIYLGVHYPGDIIAGGLVGAFFGWIFYLVTKKVAIKLNVQPNHHTLPS